MEGGTGQEQKAHLASKCLADHACHPLGLFERLVQIVVAQICILLPDRLNFHKPICMRTNNCTSATPSNVHTSSITQQANRWHSSVYSRGS